MSGISLADAKPGEATFTQLHYRVLVVVTRRVDGWAAYVGPVPGDNHSEEWEEVRDRGLKLKEPVARSICAHYFHPPIDPGGLPYCK